jgi:hypothetical protein
MKKPVPHLVRNGILALLSLIFAPPVNQEGGPDLRQEDNIFTGDLSNRKRMVAREGERPAPGRNGGRF